MRSKILTTAFIFSFLLSILTLSALSASAAEVNVSVEASATPSVIALNETTRVTINITSEGSPEIIFPVDAVLVMDCSGSMNRYGTIISGPEEVNLTTSYEKVGEFSLSDESDVEVMLQIPIDIYYSKDRFCAYLRKKGGGWQSSVRWGYSIVRWYNIQPGTYEVYAKLFFSSGERRRVFAVELPPDRMTSAKDAAKRFVDLLKEGDWASLVKFQSAGFSYKGFCAVVEGLTPSKTAVKNKIDALHAQGGTPMGEGLKKAIEHLDAHGRENTAKAIVLLTDGWWNMGCDPIEQARIAAEKEYPIYTIGWGGVNESALREIAEISGGEFYKAATGEDLQEIYEEIAKKISNITAKNATLSVELSEDVEYVGNASVEPEINGRVLTWHLGTLLANQTESISFDVKPNVIGTVKINTENSKVMYEDIFGESHEVEVPILGVKVIRSPPVAIFTVSNNTPLTNQPVIFDASPSYDPDGEIVVYRWDFDGDGDWDIEGNIVKIKHNYNKSDIYNVKLEVEDNDGAKNSTIKEINVSNEYLFSVQEDVEKIEADFKNSTISAELKDKFEENNISLSENASVTEEGEGEWVIKDREGTDEKRFIVKKEGEKLNIYKEGAMVGISGNVTWNGKHTFEGIKNATTIGSPLTITATAYEIKNELDESVNVTAELHVDGVCLNKNTKIIQPKQNGTVSVSATWIPVSSGVHFISLHVYDGPHWVGPTNDPTAKVEVFLEKVEQ